MVTSGEQDARCSTNISRHSPESARSVGDSQEPTTKDPVAVHSNARRNSSEQILVIVVDESPGFSRRATGLFYLVPAFFSLEGLAVQDH